VNHLEKPLRDPTLSVEVVVNRHGRLDGDPSGATVQGEVQDDHRAAQEYAT
jgi:hypothetical protein